MKTIERVKKMVALGIGLTMVGATVFGASAVKLSDYPAPFVVNGVPASNLALIVGDNAAASDVVGMGDIVQGLQAAAVIKTSVAGAAGPRVKLIGDSVEIGTPTNMLEINETIGKVRETLTEFDLNLLKGGSITTKRGVTKYNQYIKFNKSEAYNSNRVIFDEDEFNNVGHFFHTKDNTELFNWVLEFEEGFISDVSADNHLADLEDRDINILGTAYAIVATYFNNDTSSVRLEFLGGPVFDSLGEGDKKTYSLNGKEYEIEVVVISETTDEVLLKVNGETLPKMKTAELEPTADGTLLGIRDIIPTGKDTQSSVVRFYLGAQKIEMRDQPSTGNTGYTDSGFLVGGTIINNEVIEDSDVRIRASYDSSAVRATIQDITYSLRMDALVGDLFVPPGHGVREYMDEPEGLISPLWDIRYEGLLDTGVTTLKLNPIGRDEYKLEFTNQEGLNYVMPFMSTRQDGNLRFGDYSSERARNLVFVESSNINDNRITNQDYFVLSDIISNPTVGLADKYLAGVSASVGSSTTDNTAFTRILKYESVDSTNQILTFTDLATGTKQVTYDANGVANLVAGGVTYLIGNVSSVGNLSIDLNGDGLLTGNASVVATEGGALIMLGSNLSLNLAPGGTATAIQQNGVNSMTLTTLKKQFDEATANYNVRIPIQTRSDNRIGINRSDVKGINFLFLTSEPEIAQALDPYGTFYELFDPLTSNTPQELTIEYPLSERGVQVFVTAGTIQAEEVGGSVSEKVQPLPVGNAKLASQVTDVTQYNAIVIGGPCANPVSAQLMGNPEPCWEAVPENQAIIKLFEHANGNVAMLVAGRSALNTRQGARALLTKDVAKVDAAEAQISGTSITDITVKAV